MVDFTSPEQLIKYVNKLPGEDEFVAAFTGDDALIARVKYRLLKRYEAGGASASIHELGRWEYMGRGYVRLAVATQRPDTRSLPPQPPVTVRWVDQTTGMPVSVTVPLEPRVIVGSGYYQTIYRGVGQ